MKKMIGRLQPVDNDHGHLTVIVETPKGSRVKVAFDPETGFFQLRKTLPEGMVFPFNFGFVPNTIAEDGDPLDVLVLNEETLFTGCLIRVNPIAIIKAEQSEGGKMVRNDRIVGQALPDEEPLEFRKLQLDKQTLQQIEMFFVSYNKMYGKRFKILGAGGRKEARKRIQRAIKDFKKK